MNTQFEPLVLDEFEELFRDRGSFKQFCERLQDVFRHAFSPVVVNGRLIGLTVSPENGKELIYHSVLERWTKNPSTVDDLTKALHSEKFVSEKDLPQELKTRPRRRR